jgi:hypothetical protein
MPSTMTSSPTDRWDRRKNENGNVNIALTNGRHTVVHTRGDAKVMERESLKTESWPAINHEAMYDCI